MARTKGGRSSYAQPITFESIRVARENAGEDVRVELLTAQYAEDRPIIPEYFKKTRDLDRSVADLGSFSHRKNFPLLKDVLDRLYDGSDAEVLIYANVDIDLQPHFYLQIADRIKSGLNAFIINRRRISDRFRTLKQISTMYLEKGAPHPGFDCFVFSRSLYPKFELENVCVGIPIIEMAFSQNLFCHARNFRLFDMDFLTFHIGREIFKMLAEYRKKMAGGGNGTSNGTAGRPETISGVV